MKIRFKDFFDDYLTLYFEIRPVEIEKLRKTAEKKQILI